MMCDELRPEPLIFKSLIMLDAESTERWRQRIKEQIEEGVVLLPYYIDLISPDVDKEPQVYKESEGDK